MGKIYTTETVKLSLEYQEEGQVQGGADLIWTTGAHVVVIQEWEYRCAGNTYNKVYPDPMVGEDMIDYYTQCWKSRGDKDYYVSSVNVFS